MAASNQNDDVSDMMTAIINLTISDSAASDISQAQAPAPAAQAHVNIIYIFGVPCDGTLNPYVLDPFKLTGAEIASITNVNIINAFTHKAFEIRQRRRLSSHGPLGITDREIWTFDQLFHQRTLVDKTFQSSYQWKKFMEEQERRCQDEADLAEAVGSMKL